MKRDNPTLRDLYGHWWVEAGEESWGWWPRAVPVGVRQLARGTEGVLNGVGLIGRTGTWSRDAQHGQSAEHAFHPVLVDPVCDDEVAARLRGYAQGYSGRWRWAWTRRAEHDTCRSFQDGLMQAAGLAEGREHLSSRGSGCPFLYRPRTMLWRAQDLLDAPPAPGPDLASGFNRCSPLGGRSPAREPEKRVAQAGLRLELVERSNLGIVLRLLAGRADPARMGACLGTLRSTYTTRTRNDNDRMSFRTDVQMDAWQELLRAGSSVKSARSTDVKMAKQARPGDTTCEERLTLAAPPP